MKTIDEMLSRKLLTPEQHHDIGAWIRHFKTPDAIMAMPTPLWQALELASVLLNIDGELTQPPALDMGGLTG